MNCYVQRYSDELYHYGVLGMKWGVRRFQKKDGTRTALGKKHEAELGDGTDKKKNFIQKAREKSKAKDAETIAKMKKKFMDGGLSEEDADREAKARLRTEKILKGVCIGTAAVAVGALGYQAYRHHQGDIDSMLEAGAVLQRIESKDTDKLNSYFFASFDKADNKKYYGLLGKTRQLQSKMGYGDGAYKMNIGVNAQQKIAGVKNSKKIFDQLLKDDNDFRSWANWKFDKDYTNFNRGFLEDHSPLGTQMQQKYFDAVRKAGYSGFKDINDLRFSGYFAKNPVIFVNNGKDYTVKSVRKLGDTEVDKPFLKYQAVALGQALMPSILLYAGAGSAMSLGAKKLQDEKGTYKDEIDLINARKQIEASRKKSKKRR